MAVCRGVTSVYFMYICTRCLTKMQKSDVMRLRTRPTSHRVLTRTVDVVGWKEASNDVISGW
jgi:hypothetical protein